MDILIIGVGGQGTLLASRVLGKYAMLSGLDCKLGEIHGMSQRGGSVATHVRMAQTVYAPVVREGGADVVLAFEPLEALRYRHYLKTGGVLLVNDEKILPMPCVTGAAKYPTDVRERLLSTTENCHFLAAQAAAIAAGSEKATNVVMLGALCKRMEFSYERMREAVSACVPPKFLELNLRAFEAGYRAL